jgi:hypothetical protein
MNSRSFCIYTCNSALPAEFDLDRNPSWPNVSAVNFDDNRFTSPAQPQPSAIKSWKSARK